LKSVGDEVKRGDELVEIETDKANMVYEASDEGTLIEIVAQEGDTLPIGDVIARIGEAGEVKGDGRPSAPKEKKEEKPQEQEPRPERESEAQPELEPEPAAARAATAEPSATPSEDGRVKASPVARRMAVEMGVELAAIQGSGPGGRIIKSDVEAAASRGAAAPAPAREAPRPREAVAAGPREAPSPETAKGEVEVVELNRLQQTVARRMSESKATVPHFYLSMDVDMSEAVKMRGQLKRVVEEGRPAPTFNDMVVKACALALSEFPRANGAYRDGKIELYSRVNVGIAVAGMDALVVPTIFDADRKSLGEIAVEARQLAGKVRDGTVTPPELSGGTFTVSNLGMYGIDNFSAVINPPQAALLAVGAVAAKPAVDETSGAIVPRQLMGVTLACDHRILYGADGARFLGRIRDLLEQPLSLSL
jgi:pyruvate dehydrogenase E2 component (dihydrolipoamide acetyltransferase)